MISAHDSVFDFSHLLTSLLYLTLDLCDTIDIYVEVGHFKTILLYSLFTSMA